MADYPKDCGINDSMRVDGNVGIGISNPSEKLVIRTGNAYGLIHSNGNTEVATWVDNNFGLIGTKSNDPFGLFTNGSSPQVVLNTNGKFGINTTNPKEQLHVNGRVMLENIPTTPQSAPWVVYVQDGFLKIKLP